MPRVLNTWKEIATYLGRGVRTAQRWEHDLHLPVRRPRGKDRSAVIALTDELDGWRKRTVNGRGPQQSASDVLPLWGKLHENVATLARNVTLLKENIARIVNRTEEKPSNSSSAESMTVERDIPIVIRKTQAYPSTQLRSVMKQ